MSRFILETYSNISKTIFIRDRKGILNIEVDYDDVNHDEVDRAVVDLVANLNFAYLYDDNVKELE